ncbi:MAG: hypothetical protein DYG97_08535 [Ignavibacteria bacterium CHB3]|nr:hypothetical protein [Ignavibacteria bacterium CHB3]
MILFILQSNYPQVSGVVRDQLTLLPVAGAMVTLQTTNIKTITAADGSFVLTNAIGADLVIVSAKKYYYNSSVTVSSPTTNVSLAGVNAWVYDTYNGTGTPGGMGGFVYTRDSFLAGNNPESECASCHQPEPWIKNPFSALEPIDSLSVGSMHGISCEACHKIAQK